MREALFYPTYSSGSIGSSLGTVTNASNNPNDGIFLLSYNTAGTFQWVNQCKNTASVGVLIADNATMQLTVDTNRVYMMATYTRGIRVSFTHGASPSNEQSLTGLNSDSIWNIALIAYGVGTGDVSWMGKLMNMSTQNIQIGFNLISDGINLYLTGTFTGSTLSLYSGSTTDPSVAAATLAPLNTSTLTPTTSPTPSITNLFLACYTPSGSVKWTAKAGQVNSSIAAYGIATGQSRIYVTGWAAGPVDQYATNGLAEPTIVGKTYTPANTDAYYAMVLAYGTDGSVVP